MMLASARSTTSRSCCRSSSSEPASCSSTTVRTAIVFASTPRGLSASAAAINEASVGLGSRIGIVAATSGPRRGRARVGPSDGRGPAGREAKALVEEFELALVSLGTPRFKEVYNAALEGGGAHQGRGLLGGLHRRRRGGAGASAASSASAVPSSPGSSSAAGTPSRRSSTCRTSETQPALLAARRIRANASLDRDRYEPPSAGSDAAGAGGWSR